MGPFDRRLFIQLDSKLRAAQQIAARNKLHARLPAALHDRGDIAFQRALLRLDNHQTEQALEILQTHKFNQFEGQSTVRRLYVDCHLIAGLGSFQAGDGARAHQHFRAVMEFPDHLGSASYLGEHSRLARFMLGVIAAQQGDHPAACQLWQAIVRQRADNVYLVEGTETPQEIRPDELAALALAARQLHRPDLVRKIVAQSLPAAARAGSGEVRAARARPCSALLRITAAVVQLAATAKLGRSAT